MSRIENNQTNERVLQENSRRAYQSNQNNGACDHLWMRVILGGFPQPGGLHGLRWFFLRLVRRGHRGRTRAHTAGQQVGRRTHSGRHRGSPPTARWALQRGHTRGSAGGHAWAPRGHAEGPPGPDRWVYRGAFWQCKVSPCPCIGGAQRGTQGDRLCRGSFFQFIQGLPLASSGSALHPDLM